MEGNEKSWRNFSPSEIGDVFACISTTIDSMDKRRAQADSARQTGLKPTLHTILIVVQSGDGGGRKRLAEFFTLGNWRRFCLYLNNQQSYGKMEGAGGFSASNWSKTDPPRFSNCS